LLSFQNLRGAGGDCDTVTGLLDVLSKEGTIAAFQFGKTTLYAYVVQCNAM
jgi:hypothetical protein